MYTECPGKMPMVNWVLIWGVVSSHPLSTQTSSGVIMHPQCCLGSLGALTLAKTKALKTEAFLISVGCMDAHPQVMDPCPSKLALA
jgi:hypothetical protein